MATTNQLMDDAKCIFECVPGTQMKLAVLISLWAQIANVSTDPNVLMDNARCIFECVPGVEMKLAILISLFLSSGTAGSGIECGNGPPTSTPASGCGGYIQIDAVPPGQLWLYYSGSWHG